MKDLYCWQFRDNIEQMNFETLNNVKIYDLSSLEEYFSIISPIETLKNIMVLMVLIFCYHL